MNLKIFWYTYDIMKIKVVSWNIWCGTHLEEVINFLKDTNADIVALQEVSEDDRGNISEIIAKKLDYKYVHGINGNLPLKYLPGYKSSDEGHVKYGNAILSKYEIVNSDVHQLVTNRNKSVVEANVRVGNKVISLFSLHLNHVHQKPSELQDLQIEGLLNLLPSKNAVVMGDFNALPDSDAIERMNRSLTNTEIGSNTPTWCMYKDGCTVCLVDEIKYKLDYIFTSDDLRASEFEVHKSKGSDHLPISVIVEI